MNRLRMLIQILTVALLAAACGSDATSVSDDTDAQPTSADGDWVLSAAAVDGVQLALEADYRVTMSIDGSTVGGTAACNGYGGTIAITGDTVAISDLSSTAMGCETKVMAIESAVLSALPRAATWSRTGATLRLTGEDVTLAFVELEPVPHAELIGTTWTLDTLIQGETASTIERDSTPATLTLSEDGTFTGGTGCRTLSGVYVITGDEVQFTSFAAEGACDAQVSAQDNLVVTVLGDGFTVAIDGPRLTLMSVGGEGLSYVST